MDGPMPVATFTEATLKRKRLRPPHTYKAGQTWRGMDGEVRVLTAYKPDGRCEYEKAGRKHSIQARSWCGWAMERKAEEVK